MSAVRLHDPLAFRGRVEMHTFTSRVLEGNVLGDPHVRELPIYVPPDTDRKQLPALFCLAGFTGRGQSTLETHPWRKGVIQLYDEALGRGEFEPAVIVLPDCFTRLGGSQYVNSTAVGAYADHVLDELVPYVDALPFVREGARGVLGKSSGGFGALHLVFERPGLFQACASVSGDCGFEALFAGELLACARGLLAHGSDPARFLEAFFAEPDLSGDGHAVLIILAMAACYSPNPESPLGFDLPLDLATGERDEQVWRRWLAFDPLQRIETERDAVAALGALELLHLECGRADEFHLQWGTRRLAKRLGELGIACVHEEHDGGHRGLDPRYLALFDRFARALG